MVMAPTLWGPLTSLQGSPLGEKFHLLSQAPVLLGSAPEPCPPTTLWCVLAGGGSMCGPCLGPHKVNTHAGPGLPLWTEQVQPA